MIPIPGLLVVVVTTLMMFGGPEIPQVPPPFSGAFDPEELLIQMEQRVEERDWKKYGDLLAEDFRFIPYSGVYVEIPTVPWDLWCRSWELQFFEDLLSGGGASLSLLENVLDPGPESRGRAEWDLVYKFSSRYGTFSSRAIFVFVKVDNRWFLKEWIDTTMETDEETEGFLQTSGSLRRAVFHDE
jgi:hypothetical protein